MSNKVLSPRIRTADYADYADYADSTDCLCWRGFIVFLGLCGFAAQKVVDIRHSSWYRHPRWQGRAFFRSATSCNGSVRLRGALTCESCPCLHLRAGVAMGVYFMAPPTVADIQCMCLMAPPYPADSHIKGRLFASGLKPNQRSCSRASAFATAWRTIPPLSRPESPAWIFIHACVVAGRHGRF